MRVEMERMPVYAQLQGLRKEEASNLQALREAAQRMQLVALTYQDADQQPTERIVSPLGCFYWGKVWTLAAWCDLRHDFRSFRIDRISHLQVLDTHFQHRTGRTLQDMLRQQSCRPVSA